MAKQKIDPISHQIVRAVVSLFTIVPIAAVMLLYIEWISRQARPVPQWTTYIAMLLLIVALAPCIALQIYLINRFAPYKPLRTYGPVIPTCKKCGYDCRVSPYRCPECGSRSVKRT